MPVSTPSRSRSVDEVLGGDVPRRVGRERTAAEPSDGGVEDGRPGVERGERVRVARVARVVEVAAHGRPEPGDAARQRANGARRRDADRVREDEAVRLDLGDLLGDLDHAVGIDLAFERAAERHAQRDRAAKAVAAGAEAIRRAATIESSTAEPWLRWLNDSVTPKAKRTSSRPVASSRS